MNLTTEDVLVMLGDVGANYYEDERDKKFKSVLNQLGTTIFYIHGNHEMRLTITPTYITKKWNGGTVWYEEEYPHLLFAKDGEVFTLFGLRHLEIGSAYSVDEYYHLSRGYSWWEGEQL